MPEPQDIKISPYIERGNLQYIAISSRHCGYLFSSTGTYSSAITAVE